jgi:hypothetical protein
MDMAKQLLEQLLKKYEASKAYTQEDAARRRILLNFYQGEFKPYDFEDYEQKIYVHALVQELKKEGLIDFTWVRGDEQHILHRVWLNLDQVDKAYERAGLVSPKVDAQAVLSAVSQAEAEWQAAVKKPEQQATGWIGPMLDEMQQVLSGRQRLITPLPTARDQALLLLDAIRQLIRLSVSGQAELAERIFSLQTYGDSKTFEQQVRSRLCSLLRRYLLPSLFGDSSDPLDFDVTDDEMLSLIGLIRAPEIFEFSGPIVATRRHRRLDFGFFPACATLSSAELADLQIELPPVIRRILFVENRTNFHWLVQRRSQNEDWFDTLLVYHGGCYSPAKGQFFHKLKDAVARTERPAYPANDYPYPDPELLPDINRPGIGVYHWGDIDLGGFLIFNRLKEAFFPQLVPWHMDRSDLLSHINQAQPISRAYADRLRRLLADERYQVFHPVIGLALDRGVRLEQEALLGHL